MTPGVSYTYTGGVSLILTVPVKRRVMPGSAPMRNALPMYHWDNQFPWVQRSFATGTCLYALPLFSAHSIVTICRRSACRLPICSCHTLRHSVVWHGLPNKSISIPPDVNSNQIEIEGLPTACLRIERTSLSERVSANRTFWFAWSENAFFSGYRGQPYGIRDR
jgi:hypothetical protein